MKVGQKSIVRWIAKRVAKRSESAQPRAIALHELGSDQLRQVSGGLGESQLPKTGW